ncbi:hypothetical protein [Catellatospora sp. NPDC049609]|uniref:hypothetical protein n=1 Tax=Catellatospora sp. NPDC049609 TaxID=3155505 RepID=UPI0034328D00
MTRNPYAAPTPPSRPTSADPAAAAATQGVAGRPDLGASTAAPVPSAFSGTAKPSTAGSVEPTVSGSAQPTAAGSAQPSASGAAGSGENVPVRGDVPGGEAGTAQQGAPDPQAAPSGQGTAGQSRPVAARLVWRGVGIALAGHVLTMLLPLAAARLFGQSSDYGPAASGDPLSIFVLGGIAGQLLLGVAALVTGIARIVRRDGGVGSGILLGWAAGMPVSLVAGIVICVMLAESGNSF